MGLRSLLPLVRPRPDASPERREILVELAPFAGDLDLGLDHQVLASRLDRLVRDIGALDAARHGAVDHARLPPCLGSSTPCRVVASGTAGPDGCRVEVSLEANPRILEVAVARAGEAPVRLPPVALDRAAGEVSAAGEFAAKVWTAVVPDAPVTTWQAAADLGRGVLARAAAVEANRTLPAEEFEEVRAHLTSALAREPRNPVIHYNLGSLLYERYEEAFMHEAIRHFTVAFSASFRDDDPGTTLVAGLALTGHSLAYSQLFHRFGQSDDEVLVNARIAARRAVEMLEELASRTGSPAIRRAVLRAGHAEAMSLHVTEDERDIEDAIAIYEDLVRRWEAFGGPPAVLVNNLAYQHMAFEGRDEPGCNPETYERAARLFERALEIQPDFEMAWANLGNVHRLLKRYDDSERDYREAIAAVERQGKRYPPAHIEFARLLLERGDLAAAEAEYEVALAQTESPSSEAKIHGDWADALRALNQDAAARAAAERGLALWPEEHRCSSVLAKLDAEPTADVDESNMEEAR